MLNNQALKEIEKISAENFNQLTQDYVKATAGKLPGVTRAPGLLVTNDDIRKIKRYIKVALELPTDTGEIEQRFHYDTLDVAGLKSADMQVLYKTINDHAHTWDSIEKNMRTVGSDLHIFAENFTTSCDAITTYLKSLPSYLEATGKVGDLSPEEIDKLPELRIKENEQHRLLPLAELVNDLKQVITQHSQSTKTVKAEIETFNTEIQNKISPTLARKIALSSSRLTDDKAIELNSRLDVLKERIEEKSAEAQKHSSDKWWGLFGGAVGLLITSTIFGGKATEARKEAEALTADKFELEREIKVHDSILALLREQETHLQDLQLRVNHAASGSSNLASLWALIENYVRTSSSQLDGVTNAMFLVAFVSRLNQMKNNWASIKTHAFDLLTAFNNVVEEQ